MSMTPTSSTNAIDADARRHDIPPRPLFAGTAPSTDSNDSYLDPRCKFELTGQYTLVQDYATQVLGVVTAEGEDELTPHQESRRKGFFWDASPAYNGKLMNGSNPLPPGQLGSRTLPPLAELLRLSSNEDADTAHNASYARVNTFELQSPTTRPSYSFTASDSSGHESRISSTAYSASAKVKRGSKVKILLASEGTEEHQSERKRQEPQQPACGDSSNDHKGGRKLSFVLPQDFQHKHEKTQKPTPIAEDHEDKLDADQTSGPSPSKSSLRDRRKVKLDLSLPTVLDLPTRGRSPVPHLSSITPSRPRSPKTPWVRNEPPKWKGTAERSTAPIVEEDYISQALFGEGVETSGILPGNDIIRSSHSPTLERLPTRVRDRRFVSRSRSRRQRSGRSGTSESTLARTPDESWTPEDSKANQAKQAQTNTELQQLGQVSKSSRSCRLRWGRSTTRSSDEALQTPEAQSTSRRFSVNPFKKAGRITDQTDVDKEKGKKQSGPSWPWWMGKQAVAPASNTVLTTMTAPPTFDPLGLHRIPTPPIVDANGEIKGQLAGFFFDHGRGTPGKRPKASAGIHWDSDALLMSYSSLGMELSDSTEEEGPEGPTIPSHAVRVFGVDHDASYGTPGLVSAPGAYLEAGGVYAGQHLSQKTPSPPLEVREVWFRVPQEESVDAGELTVEALRKKEERRRFEWIVPEHLPSSPLCPLNAKYQGYSKGMCYWHSKSKSKHASESRPKMERGAVYVVENQTRGARDWSTGEIQSSTRDSVQAKNRRLQSFSTP